MKVNGTYGNYPAGQTGAVKGKSEAEGKAKKTEEAAPKRTDTFTRSEQASVQTDYRSKSALGMKNEAMKDMVAQMLGNQATKSTAAFNSGVDEILKGYGLTPIKSDGSDDFWGAEKTANRILDFAKSLVGDDKEAFGKIKNAFEKGFKECEKIWGGKLPGVCYDTLDRVRNGFDEWEKEKFSNVE